MNSNTSKQVEEETWEILLVLAADQYRRGQLGDPKGDNFSEIITPIHTKFLALINSADSPKPSKGDKS